MQDESFGNGDAFLDDVVDFPLGPHGDLDLERVKLWWGIKMCAVRHSEEKKKGSRSLF
jgi:hypothetical protein